MRPMRVTETVDTAVALFRANWRPFMAIVAIVTIPLTFVQQLVTRGSFQAFPTSFDPSTTTATPAPSAGVVVSTVILSMIGFLIVRPFLTAAMTRAISAAYLAQSVDVGAAYRFALRRFGSVLWVQILEILALIGVGIAFVLVATVLTAAHVVPVVVLLAIGVFILVAVLLVRWIIATPAVVVEDARGAKALRRSWDLTRSSFWRLFGTLLLTYLLAGIVGFIVGTVPTIASAFVPAGWLLRVIGGVLSAIVTTPFISAVTVLLYFDARIRREGLDIAMMLRDIVTER